MLSEVLRYIEAQDGAPITSIRRAFDLPAEMAAHLCIQLQDAGLVAEWSLEPCHHQDGASTCTHCSGSDCRDDAHMTAVLTADDFKQGCCGMNAPFRLTDRGRAYLAVFS